MWNYLNSPFVLTIISLVFGSLMASWITSIWQRRAYHHQVKVQYAQDIVKIYQEYIRLLRGNNKSKTDDFDLIHPRLVHLSKVTGFLFKNKHIGEKWATIANQLSSILDLQRQGRDKKLIERKLKALYDDGEDVIEKMFKEII